jgi:hypothetical protein
MYFADEPIIGTKVELKYCECCGGLWLRKVNSVGVLCEACEQQMADMPGEWTARLKQDSLGRVCQPRLPKKPPSREVCLPLKAMAGLGPVLVANGGGRS